MRTATLATLAEHCRHVRVDPGLEGIGVGIAALGALIPIRALHLRSAADVSGMHHALLVCGAFAGLGAVAAWVLTRARAGVAPATEAAAA